MPKPYYEHAGITIYHADCREVLPTLPKVDLVLTDPPYGIDFDTDYTRFKGGVAMETNFPKVYGDAEPFDPSPWMKYPKVILWGANCFSNKLPMGSWLVWDKRHSNGAAFLADAEVAWMNRGHGVYIHSQVWQGFLRSEHTEHPTQKPSTLMRWCIERAGGAQDILDPFMGSGSTLVAAKRAGLPAIGIEIEERYCEIAAKRLSQEMLPFTELMGTAMRDADEAAEQYLIDLEAK